MTETSRGALRALMVLRALNENNGAGVSRISQVTGISRSAVYRIVGALADAGYLRLDVHTDTLRLTPLVRQLSSGYDEESWITEIAGPILDELQREVIWPTDLFCFFDDTMVMCRTTRRSSPWTFDKAKVGLRIPLLVTACGRAYLAFASDRIRLEVLDRLLTPIGRERHEAEKLLSQVRTQGYALRESGYMRETGSMAVPVLVDDKVRCSIAITYIASAIAPATVVARYLHQLQDAAKRIGNALTAEQC